jgi:hypothetical protein
MKSNMQKGLCSPLDPIADLVVVIDENLEASARASSSYITSGPLLQAHTKKFT